MRGIDKAFNGVPVLKQVNLTVESGSVHALLGENGAGKSTLMNVLTGVHAKDSGTVKFDGNLFNENITVSMSEKAGIAFVHQELNLFNDMTVWENIYLNREIAGRYLFRVNKRAMIAGCENLFKQLNVAIDPCEVVENLRISEKQLLEISKALFFNAKLLILDEPTTSLNNEEIAHLFKIINNLKAAFNTAFIFISHKMPEIFELCDDYTVLRNGEFIAAGKIADVTAQEITEMMVGTKLSSDELYHPRPIGGVILKLNNLSGPGFNNINLEIKKGQIIGLTGLQGSGSSELMQCIFGVTKASNGSVEVGARGKAIKAGSIHAAMKAGIAMLASNRKENSVIPDMTLLENMYISEHTLSAKRFNINKRAERSKFENYKNMLDIKAHDSADAILSLSGGNQQKVFIARWLNTNADILLFDNPTQGIDVGAKAEIYKLILELAQTGKTILVNTLEIPELQKIADYCAIFYEGRIVKVLEHKDIDEHTVMMYSTGSQFNLI